MITAARATIAYMSRGRTIGTDITLRVKLLESVHSIGIFVHMMMLFKFEQVLSEDDMLQNVACLAF